MSRPVFAALRGRPVVAVALVFLGCFSRGREAGLDRRPRPPAAHGPGSTGRALSRLLPGRLAGLFYCGDSISTAGEEGHKSHNRWDGQCSIPQALGPQHDPYLFILTPHHLPATAVQPGQAEKARATAWSHGPQGRVSGVSGPHRSVKIMGPQGFWGLVPGSSPIGESSCPIL